MAEGLATQDVHSLLDLPNELLLNILVPLDTKDLLPLLPISRRFFSLCLRIIHHRLAIAAPLGDRMLLLEAFHPAAKLFEPELVCEYLGTDGLDEGEKLVARNAGNEEMSPGQKLQNISGLYSRFRPRRREAENPLPQWTRRHPAGDIPGSRTHPDSETSAEARHHARVKAAKEQAFVKQFVNIDGSELFSQLRAITSLAKGGPKRGIFSSLVPVSDGVVRLWRDWLAKQNKYCEMSNRSLLEGTNELDRLREMGVEVISSEDAQAAGKGKGKERAADDPFRGVLWVNDGQVVGIKFRVYERKIRRPNPILIHRDEEVAVSYEIQYEEVLVQTRHLLLVTERSLFDQNNISDKAIVFGQWG